jgi:hypothetical protein
MSCLWITGISFMFLLPIIAHGQTKPSGISSTAGLKAAAEKTYANYNRAYKTKIDKPQPIREILG